jgi:polyisoprenoid-binding protein YceI
MKISLAVALALLTASAAMADIPPPPPPPTVTPPPDAAAAPPAVVEPTAGAEAPPTGPQTYTLDAAKSSFVVLVFKAGAASGLAHDHVVRATAMSGTVVADAANLATAKVDVTVQTKGLVNDETKMRKAHGLEGELPEKDRKTILENMQNADQLDVAKFPTITFVSTSVVPGAGGKATVNGTLTIKGKSQPIAFPATIAMKGKTVDGKGTMKLKFSQFGIEPYSAFFGAVRNQDDITLKIHFVATAPY